MLPAPAVMSQATVDSAEINSLIQTYFGKGAQASQASIAALVDYLVRGKVQSIKELVELLGPRLTSTEAPERLQGMATVLLPVTQCSCHSFRPQ